MGIEDKDNTGVSTDQPKYITDAELNKALDQRFGRFIGKIEGLISEKFQSKEVVGTEETSAKEPENYSKFEKAIKKGQERITELENRYNSEKIHNEITSNLRGKVSETWTDVAVMDLKNRTKVKDGSSFIEINDAAYPIAEGISEWLKMESNKRFLPAPTTVTSSKNNSKLLSSNVQNTLDKEYQMQLVREKLGISDFLVDDE